MKEKLSPKLCTSSSTADSVCYCSFPAFCDCIGALCLLSCFCSPEFSSRHPLSVCHQHLSSCLIYLISGPLLYSARSLSSAAQGHLCLICQEILFCSSKVSPGNLLSICHQPFSSSLNCLRASSLIWQEPLFRRTGPARFNQPRDFLCSSEVSPGHRLSVFYQPFSSS